MSDEQSLRRALTKAGARLAARGLVAGSEGNLSARLEGGSLLLTASGTRLGALGEENFVLLDPAGKPLHGSRRPTSEAAAHLAAYRLRPDIGAVAHAHPPHALALSLAGRGGLLLGAPLAEAAYAFGSVPTCRYAVPGTPEGGEVIAEWIGTRDALLLDRHGALTVGRDIEEAVDRMEMLEAVARVLLLADRAGGIRPLAGGEADRIAEAAIAAGAREEAVHAWRGAVPTTP